MIVSATLEYLFPRSGHSRLLSRDVYISTGDEHRSKLGQFKPAVHRPEAEVNTLESVSVSFNRRPGGLERDGSHRPNLNKRLRADLGCGDSPMLYVCKSAAAYTRIMAAV